jgi:hypothetical protein
MTSKLKIVLAGWFVLVIGIILSACEAKETDKVILQSTPTTIVSSTYTSPAASSTVEILQESTPVPSETQTPVLDVMNGFGYYEDYDHYESDILFYLNSGGSPELLEASLQSIEVPEGVTNDQVRLTDPVVSLKDVTGNENYEVIVLLRWQSNALHQDDDRLLLILSQEAEGYQTLAEVHARRLVERPYDMDLEMVQDINLDGMNEIVLTLSDFQGPSGTNFLYVTFILAWNGAEFEQLIQVPEKAFLQPYSNGAGSTNTRPSIEDHDGDGKLEVIVEHIGLHPYGSTSYQFAETGPMRGRTEIWAWDGEKYTLTTQLEPPIYRFHVVQDADDAVLAGEYELAMSLYLQAIFDDELSGWGIDAEDQQIIEPIEERYRLSAYATFRIMVLHALWGNEVEAEKDLETMLAYYPEGNLQYPFTQMATIFLEAFQESGDVSVACEKASVYAQSAVYCSTQTWMSEIPLLDMLGSRYYGWYNRDYALEDICPF